MPISIILLGVFIIFINFKIADSTIKKIPIQTLILNVVLLVAFLTMCMKPILFFNRVFVSLCGFFVFTILSLYFLKNIIQQKNLKAFLVTFTSLFLLAFLTELCVPFMQKEFFDVTVLLIGLLFGVVAYISNKKLDVTFSAIFLVTPIISTIWFLLKEVSINYEMLLLGTGNLFEISMLAFTIVLTLSYLKELNYKIKLPKFLVKTHKKGV